jgi:hypothetical protein
VSIVAKTWHQKGSTKRGVSWVYASLGRPAKGKTYSARWLYKTPGGSWKVGEGWKKTRRGGEDTGAFVETWWGSDGHTGPRFPRKTRLCTEFRGISTKACVTLT